MVLSAGSNCDLNKQSEWRVGTEVQPEEVEERRGRQQASATLSGSATVKRSREGAIAGEDAELKKGFYLNVGDTRECLHTDGKKTLGLEG